MGEPCHGHLEAARRLRWLAPALLLAGLALSGVSAAGPDESREPLGQERELLSDLKAGRGDRAETLVQLARVRERRGDLQAALNTWGVLSREFGAKRRPNESSAPDHTYGEAASFWMERLRRKGRLRAHPPRPDSPASARSGDAQAKITLAVLAGRDGQVDLAVQADMDGDRIEEVFAAGTYGPPGDRQERFLCILKRGTRGYETAWQSRKEDLPLFPFRFLVIDRDGDGWKEVLCGFEPDTDNAATLYFNGKSAILLP